MEINGTGQPHSTAQLPLPLLSPSAEPQVANSRSCFWGSVWHCWGCLALGWLWRGKMLP